jgi:sulfur carrier protein
MDIIINNQPHQVQENTSVQIILNDLIGEKQKGIAVAVNEAVVPKTQWETYVLQPNDQLLVIKATQGG